MTSPYQNYYTPAEDAAIITQWSRLSLVEMLRLPALQGRSYGSLSRHAQRLVRAGRLRYTNRAYQRPWRGVDEDYLIEHWGLVPDAQVARWLRRSIGACQDRASLLGITRRQAFLSLNDLSRLLGVDVHTVMRFDGEGWLPLQRMPVGPVNKRCRGCQAEELERFLQRYPEHYQWRRIEDEPWRSLGRAAWEARDYLTTEQVARLKGCSSDWVVRHCRGGKLPAVKGWLHGGTGVWFIRRVDAEAWQVRGQGGTPVRLKLLSPQRPTLKTPKGRPARLQPVQWRAG